LLLQAGDDRLAVDPVLLRLGLVAADDVAGTVHLDLFRKQLGFAPAALDQQRGKGGLVGEHDIADHSRAAFPSPENVFELSLLQGLEGGGGDHAPVGHHADPPDPEPLAQPIHHRQQHGAVGGIAGKHLGADRTPLAIDHDSQNHLLEVRPVILGVAVGTEALTTRPLEREGRGIHEHNREIGKQVAPPFEQLLLDQVLDAAWGQITLGGRLHLLAEPGHGPIEVMQSQIAGAGDGVVGHPLLTAPVGAGYEQSVQDTDEDGPLDCEREAPATEQIRQDIGDPEPLPQPPEEERPPDAGASNSAGLHLGENHGPF
jgi:hypothetical protein